MKKYIYSAIAFLMIPVFKLSANWQDGITEAGLFDLPDETPYNILTYFLEWITMILAVIAALAFIISGFMFITSGGNPEQAGKAKDFVKYSIIGLIVSLSAYVIIIFIDYILRA